MKKTLFISLLIACLTLFAGSLQAAPAIPWLVEKQQPDGTTLSVYIRGDEKVSWMQSPDGYTLLYNESGSIVYACLNQAGDLVPSQTIYSPATLRSSSETNVFPFEKGLRYSQSQVDSMTGKWKPVGLRSSRRTQLPITGEKKALCILVDFKDKAFVKSVDEIDRLMNQIGYNEGTNKGSVRDFYRENSYGQLDFTVSVVGSYTLSQPASYYAPNAKYQEFAREVLLLADADVDFRQFANEDGQLETVHILFAGHGDEAVKSGEQIWSHKWELETPLVLDGVQCSVYSCSPELRGTQGEYTTSIGVICHELCHVFGASDYYDTDGAGSGGEYLGTGNWDLMATGCWNGNGDSPAHINMFQKILFGWVNPIELTDAASISTIPNSTEHPIAYTIKPYTNNEQYVLENKQQVGFNSSVPSQGLLIYHIHDSASSGTVDNTSHPQQAYLVAAAASSQLPNQETSSYGYTNLVGVPFGRNNTISSFTRTTTPAMFRWENDAATLDGVLDKPLTNIRQAGGLISFDFMEGGDNPFCYPVSNPRTFVAGSDTILAWDKPIGDRDDYTYELYSGGEAIVLDWQDAFVSIAGTSPFTSSYCIKAKTDDCESSPICFYPDSTDFYYMIDSLSTEQIKQGVLLAWVLPEQEQAFDSLLLYRNDSLLTTLPHTVYSYRDSLVVPGNYVYTIIADYGNNNYSFPRRDTIPVELYIPCGEIEDLQARIELDTIRLTWAEVEDVEAYHIYRDGILIGDSIASLCFQDTVFAAVDSIYTYSVEVADPRCLVDRTPIKVVYVNPFLPVTDLVLRQSKQDVLLSWAMPDTELSVDSLYLFRDDTLLITLPDTALFHRDTLVAPGDYIYSLVVDYGNHKYSPTTSGTIPVELYIPCGEIEDLQAITLADTINLSWLEVEDVESYLLFRDSVLITEIRGLSYQDTILARVDSTYSYYVEVADTLCLIPGSELVVDYIYPFLPVVDLAAEQIKQDVLLSWTMPDTDLNIDSLYLYRNDSLLITLPDTVHSYRDSLVAPGDYVYSMIVDYGNNKQAWPVYDSIAVELYIPCGEILDLQAVALLDTLHLQWAEVEDVEAYNVYRDGILIAAEISALSYRDTIFAPADSIYTYYIEVADTRCLVPGSSIEVDYTYPFLPAGDFQTGQVKQDIRLSWSLPITDLAVDSLYLYRGDSLLLALPDTALAYCDSLVVPGSYIYSLIVGYENDKYSLPVSDSIGVELYIPCGEIEDLHARTDLDTLFLTWAPIEDVAYYHVYRDQVLIGDSITTPFFQHLIPEAVDSVYTYLVEVADTLCLLPAGSIEVPYTYPYLPVSHLVAEQVEENVRLSWDSPSTDALADSLRVYRNGTLFVSLPGEETHCVDSLVAEGDYVYSIITDYGKGRLSEETAVSIRVVPYSWPDNIETIAGEIRVTPTITEGWIRVYTPNSALLKVRTLSGLLLAEYETTGLREILLDYPPGVYLISIEMNTGVSIHKVIRK